MYAHSVFDEMNMNTSLNAKPPEYTSYSRDKEIGKSMLNNIMYET